MSAFHFLVATSYYSLSELLTSFVKGRARFLHNHCAVTMKRCNPTLTFVKHFDKTIMSYKVLWYKLRRTIRDLVNSLCFLLVPDTSTEHRRIQMTFLIIKTAVENLSWPTVVKCYQKSHITRSNSCVWAGSKIHPRAMLWQTFLFVLWIKAAVIHLRRASLCYADTAVTQNG